jgi:antitoxin ParD1/3/4
MNISLTPELEKFIAAKVKSGMYQTASEVVRDALRLLDEDGKLREAQLKQMRDHIAKGLAQAEAGETVSAEEVWRRVREARDQRRKRA